DEPFFLVQSDCIRKPDAAFLKMIEDAGKITAKEKKLLTGGIKATEPNIGVDYLEIGDRLKSTNGQEVYKIAAFLGRRPTYRETKALIAQFNVVTHCNHACWYPDLMLEAYKKYQPDWYEALMQMREAFGKPNEDAIIEAIYEKM